MSDSATNETSLPSCAVTRLGNNTFNPGTQIGALAFAPDGKTLWIGVAGKLFGVDSASGALIHTQVLNEGSTWCDVNAIVYSPKNTMLAVGCKTDIYIYAVGDWSTPLHVLRGHKNNVTDLAWQPQETFLASVARDKTLRIWRMDTGVEWECSSQLANTGFGAVAYSPDGEHIAASGSSEGLQLFDHEAMPIHAQTPLGHRSGETICWSSDGTSIVTCKGKSVVIWKRDTNTLDHVREVDSSLTSASFYNKGAQLLVLGKHLESWDTATQAELWKQPIPSWGNQVAVDPQETQVVLGGYEGILHRFDLSTGEPRDAAPRQFKKLGITPKGVLIALRDKVLEGWDLNAGESLWKIETTSTILAVSPDEELCVIMAGQMLELRSATDGSLLGSHAAHHGHWSAIAIPPTAPTTILCCSFRVIHSYARGSNYTVEHKHTWSNTNWVASCESALRCDRTLIFKSRNEAMLIDPKTHKTLGQWRTGFEFIALSPDGTCVAGATSSMIINIRNAEDGDILWKKKLSTHKEQISVLAFSPDGTWVAAGTNKGHIYMMELESRAVTPPLKGHASHVNALTFTHDGTRLISGGKDATAIVWDVNAIQQTKPAPKKRRKKK